MHILLPVFVLMMAFGLSMDVYAAHNEFSNEVEENEFQSCLSDTPPSSIAQERVTDIHEFVPEKVFVFRAAWEHAPEPVHAMVLELPYQDATGTWLKVVEVRTENPHMDGWFEFNLADFGIIPYQYEIEPLCPSERCWNICNWVEREPQ